MKLVSRIRHRVKRWRRHRSRRRPGPTVWHHADYRIAIEGLGLETKRPDMALWALVDFGIVRAAEVARPTRVSYRALSAVHTEKVLAALSSPEVLAPVFGAHPSELPVENIARTIRLSCGATVAGARRALAGAGPQVNLLGGFHHASPNRSGGFSVVNDIAVAISELRRMGFEGHVNVIDVDAHPPDGTADCLSADPESTGSTWIGSISGSDWGEVGDVDETFLPGATDESYLDTLDGLLRRMPAPDLTFVVAGGDVLAGDRFGGLDLTLGGARRRDERIRRALRGTPSVWLSGGGYSDIAWKVLFQTVATLAMDRPVVLPDDYDPMRVRFSRVMQELAPPTPPDDLFSDLDVAEALGMRAPGGPRLLSTYTAEWAEHAFHRYGLLEHIERLGYSGFRVEIANGEDGDRMRLFGTAQGSEHMLFEFVVARVTEGTERFLFVNWLTLRHPIAKFTVARPRLPNQDVPGLGLAKEAGELMGLMAERLGLDGVAVRPAAYHVAFTARHDFTFVAGARQARFEALIRDLGDTPLAELTVAIDEGRVTRDGEPYRWEPDLMVSRLDGRRTVASGDGGTFRLVDDPAMGREGTAS